MFINNRDRKGTGYCEFQLCKKDNPIKTRGIIKKKKTLAISFWEDDSIYITPENFDLFSKKYNNVDLNENVIGDNGEPSEFNYYGDNYYSKETTQKILDKLKEYDNKDLDILRKFLKTSIEDFNGFFILGI